MNQASREYSIGQIIEMQDELNELYIPEWKTVMRPSMYFTQIIDEVSELLRSGIEYKWWSDVPEEQFNKWNVKIEATDIIFFATSMIRLWMDSESVDRLKNTSINLSEEDLAAAKACGVDMKFVHSGNKLNHDCVGTVVSLLSDELHTPTDNAPYILQFIAYAADMCASEASAVYAAKYELNKFRISADYKSGKYQKVKDGVEDNERLRVVVEKFMSDKTMSLDDVRAEVVKMFFKETPNK